LQKCADLQEKCNLPVPRLLESWNRSAVDGSISLYQPGCSQGVASISLMDSNSSSQFKAFRKPVRLCITICHSTCAELERLSLEQGRSRSNLAAYLIETGLVEVATRSQDF
jgi:hypothetical protein